MNDSMAHGDAAASIGELPRWRAWLGGTAGLLLGLAFIVAGIWKITDPLGAAVRLQQAQVPHFLSLPAAVTLGIFETFAGTLLLVPKLRRWGAWLTGLLLAAFMIYIAAYYDVLRGEECNCFPWIQRAVGPAFFLTDALMLAMAWLAGWGARPSEDKRAAALVFGAVAVFALVFLGVALARQTGIKAPDSILVEGRPLALAEGRVFIFFFNPECLHCDRAARELARLNWGQTRVVAAPTQLAQFGREFLQSSGLKALLTTDTELLRRTFPFTDVPYGVAIENGYQRAAFTHFEGPGLAASLRRLGFVR
ncbi:MAG: hypothetical protein RMK57_13485 [Bryobacterales bacterium]|nr:hypothetical protein [Bryobacteraceae bacterium]MDW8355531.1 hypothetical protein [Bryobacterales bacterium]